MRNGVRPQIDSLGKHVFPGKLVAWGPQAAAIVLSLVSNLRCFPDVGSGSFSAYCSDDIQAGTLDRITKTESSYTHVLRIQLTGQY